MRTRGLVRPVLSAPTVVLLCIALIGTLPALNTANAALTGRPLGHAFYWSEGKGNQFLIKLDYIIDPAPVNPGQTSVTEADNCGPNTNCKVIDATFTVHTLKGFFYYFPGISALGSDGQDYGPTGGNLSSAACRGESFVVGYESLLQAGQSATFCVSFVVPSTVVLEQVTWTSGSGLPALGKQYGPVPGRPAQVTWVTQQTLPTRGTVAPGMKRVVVRVGHGEQAATWDQTGHIDFWALGAGHRWKELAASTYPLLGQGSGPPDLSVSGSAVTGMHTATFILHGVFTGDGSGDYIVYGNGAHGWGALVLGPGDVLVPNGRPATLSGYAQWEEAHFAGGDVVVRSGNLYFDQAVNSFYALVTHYRWSGRASHFVDVADTSFIGHFVPRPKGSPPYFGCKAAPPRNGTVEMHLQVALRLEDDAPIVDTVCPSVRMSPETPVVVEVGPNNSRISRWLTAPAWLLATDLLGPVALIKAPRGEAAWVLPASVPNGWIVQSAVGQGGWGACCGGVADVTFSSGRVTHVVLVNMAP